ncbi:double-strand break repair helicase AddA [Paracoccus sp. 1_MG-2023]|uniref:double-strand break repair helicase AddA n=1 Tax=unclassified Paracoccus (in: a-proteobacteria) TaxID=2688777 RepID=UPI001C08593E|nr:MULTISPECIES: double-strand break repair helicase AddA [unclassified Paracoccus (in: a-proteobacteria)]MBU2957190.1 double-strand break repair helicase AddA [Paracoccus sp. C2R09]MDO6669077.1 double-strand break repair helicase AddA [Paracoccus sp. 1_MG-2023]
MDEATLNQIGAADPLRTTWLTANAGSGKTRVLTDRVARLLLGGTAPERILCLTYTKAAATEMQNRLLARLGRWAMLPEDALREELASLGEDRAPDLPEARRLFARAIEAPGGLKVQTIHSFCAALLRRFPLEAGVPMGFAELDDRSARAMRAEILEDMAETGHPAMGDLTALVGGDGLDGFLGSFSEADFAAPPDADAIRAAMGVPPGMTQDALLAQVFDGNQGDLFDAILPVMAKGGATDAKIAQKLGTGNWRDPGQPELALLVDQFLTGAKTKEPFTAKIGKLPTKGLREGPCGPFMDELDDLMLRVQEARLPALGLAQAERTLRLHRFGHEFTQRMARAKAANGWLDFDDLIRRTAQLLGESSMAQWVLWRLDGGIDHILVDEAQDTSPEQWRVIRRLTDEFTSGDGAHDRPRTLFVVGDPKQSIYSFQGADIAVFEDMRDRFGHDFAAVQQPMQTRGLAHSFRSSPAILTLVDAVFQGKAAQGLGDPPRHVAFRSAMPGRVDIWPALPKPDKPEAADWTSPVDAPADNDADVELGRLIAGRIADMLGQPILDGKTGQPRAIHAGDIQILVQRRGSLFEALIGALKSAGLPVAGADRLRLAAELAVRDITATLSVLATPEDDLSLAAALRSPLFGLSEDDLYRLSSGRKRGEFLWARLRNSDHRAVWDVLADMADHADYLRPHDLIARLLTRHGGRQALLARLGAEAEDGIDELMSQALAYEQVETPSLTGFLVWLQGDDVEVKRQLPGGSGGLIRVMTVHGSKGLESPIVILPETQKRRPSNMQKTVRMGDMPAWRGAATERCDAVADAVTDWERRQEEERRRLLYVAMTRAESWLIVAAAGDTGEGLDSWHSMIAEGAATAALPRAPIEIEGLGIGLRLSFGDWPDGTVDPPTAPLPPRAAPDWAHRLPPQPPEYRSPVAATALGGAKALAAPSDGDRDAAMLRGTRLHLLLEHLPHHPAPGWPDIARAILSGAEGGLPDPEMLDELLSEAQILITAPDLAQIMDPGQDANVLSEVALTAPLPGIGTLNGVIDRLIVTADRILAVDYKTNAEVPATPEATPLGILRQMAAYRAALTAIWSDRPVEVAVLWTTTRSVMTLPGALLDGVMRDLAGS